MRIKMKVSMSGTRNGQDWPSIGAETELPDNEGAEMCAAGLAEPVVGNTTETAVPPEAEQRNESDEATAAPDAEESDSDTAKPARSRKTQS